jgi:hypothetical protein
VYYWKRKKAAKNSDIVFKFYLSLTLWSFSNVQLPSAQAATTPTATTGFAPQHAGKTTGTYLLFLFSKK